MLPVTQVTFSDTDFLAFADEEMDSAIIPYITAFQEDYFLFSELLTFSSGTKSIAIPHRAVGNKLRDVTIEESNVSSKMTRIVVDDIPFNQGRSDAYYIENNEIVRLDENSTKTIRVRYYIRPSSLVLDEQGAYITSIDRVTGEIGVDKIPNTFTGSSSIDFIQTKAPHKCISIDKSIAGLNTTTKTITFNPEDIPLNLVVGDIICLAETTIIPQIPTDVHPLLAQRIACRCLEALGDAEGLNAANVKLIEMESKLSSVLTDRVESAPKKVINRSSTLSSSKRFRR